MYQSGDVTPVISNAVFEDNRASCCGGALSIGSGATTVTTAVFSQNIAAGSPGGAALEIEPNGTLKNVTLYGNVEETETPAQIINRGVLAMHNSIVWAGSPPVQLDQNGTASIRHSLVQGGAPTGVTDFAESSDSDPLFVEPPMNLRLLANSPAIDTGNTQLSGLTTLDVAGSPRVVDGDGDGTADIDRGAYEYQ